jgi:hypothetical protein
MNLPAVFGKRLKLVTLISFLEIHHFEAPAAQEDRAVCKIRTL